MATIDEDPVKKSLLRAIIRGNCQKVADIVSKNDAVSPNEPLDSAQNKLLHKAARYGKVEVVKTLIEELNADPNALNKFDMTPLHHAAVEGSAGVIEVLLDAGGDANKFDNAKRLPLHWACANGFLDASRLLIEKGKSKCKMADKEGFTPLHRCCQEPPPQPPKKAKNAELPDTQKPEKSKSQIKQEKEESDRLRGEIIKALVGKGVNVNITEPQGLQTPLHLAAMNGFTQVCKQLLEAGADVNAINKISKTPLIYAASEDNIGCLQVLADSPGIDLNKVDVIHNEWNALHYAILQDNVEAVKILIRAGADKEQRDGIGRDPVTIAGDHFKLNVQRYLESI